MKEETTRHYIIDMRDRHMKMIQRKKIKILHLEDEAEKFRKIQSVLVDRCRLDETGIERVMNLEAGLTKIEDAAKNGETYQLMITDMQYPLRLGEPAATDAGKRFLDIAAEKGWNVPIILISRDNLDYRTQAYGCLQYGDHTDWELELVALIEKLANDIEK